MNLEEHQISSSLRSDSYVNGQATDQMVAAGRAAGRQLGLRATHHAALGRAATAGQRGSADRYPPWQADPAGVDMDRVASAMRRSTRSGSRSACARRRNGGDRRNLAGATGANLAVRACGRGGRRGAGRDLRRQHAAAAMLIVAERGGRRWSASQLWRGMSEHFVQPFCAALLAGMVGALAVRFELSSSLRLVAVCPCMVLVPGPHMLNGTLDLVGGRVRLGAARLIYACW